MPTHWDPLSLRRILGSNPTGLLRVLIIFVEDKPETPQCCTKGTADIFNTLIKQNLIGKNLIPDNINNGRIVLQAIQQLASYEGHMEGLPVLVKHGLLNIISKVISQISDRLMQNDSDQWDQIYEDILETISSISDHSPKAKSKTIQTFGHELLSILTAETFRFGTRLEALKTLNLLLVHCPGHVRDKFSSSVPQTTEMSKLGKLLSTAGDYEFQVGLIEVLFRLTNKANRDGFAAKWFRNNGKADAFLKIRDSEFETDCRIFLNELNKSGTTGVYTCPCVSVRLGMYEVKKPDDPKYTKFWVDFNAGSRRISIFCCQEPTESQKDEIDAGMWETVSLLQKDVRSYNCDEEHSRTDLKIFLHKNVRELISFGPRFEGNCVTISFPTGAFFHGPLQQTFGSSTFSQEKLSQQSTQSTFSRRHHRKVSKASVPSQHMQNQKSADMNKSAEGHPQVCKNSSSSVQEEAAPLERETLQSPVVKKVKVSVPAEPMRTPKVQMAKSYPPLAMQPTPKRHTPIQIVPTESTEKALHPKASPASTVTSKVVDESEQHVALPENIDSGIEVASMTREPNLEETLTQSSDKVVPSSCPTEDTTTIPDSQARGIPLFPLIARSVANQNDCYAGDDDDDDWSTTKAHKKGKMAALKEYLTDNDPQYTNIPMNIHKVSNTPALSTVSEESSKISLHEEKHTAPLDVIMENEEQCLQEVPETSVIKHQSNQPKLRGKPRNDVAARQPLQNRIGKKAAKQKSNKCNEEQPVPNSRSNLSPEHNDSDLTDLLGNTQQSGSVGGQRDAKPIASTAYSRKTRKTKEVGENGLQTSIHVIRNTIDALPTAPLKMTSKNTKEVDQASVDVTCTTINSLPAVLMDYEVEKRNDSPVQKSKVTNKTRTKTVTSKKQGVKSKGKSPVVQRSPAIHYESDEIISQTQASSNLMNSRIEQPKESIHENNHAKTKNGRVSKQGTTQKSPIKVNPESSKKAAQTKASEIRNIKPVLKSSHQDTWEDVNQRESAITESSKVVSPNCQMEEDILPIKRQEPKFFKARYRERLAKQSSMSPTLLVTKEKTPQKSKTKTSSKRNICSQRSPIDNTASQPIFSSMDSPIQNSQKTITQELSNFAKKFKKSNPKACSPTEIYEFEPRVILERLSISTNNGTQKMNTPLINSHPKTKQSVKTANAMTTHKPCTEREYSDDIASENENISKKTKESKSRHQKPSKLETCKTQAGLSTVYTGFDTEEIYSERICSDNNSKVSDEKVKQHPKKSTKRASIDPYTLEPCSSKPRTATKKKKHRSVFSETDDNLSVRSELSWLGSTARKRKACTPLKAYGKKQPAESKHHTSSTKEDCTDDEWSEDDSKEEMKRQALKKPRRKRKRKLVESPLITEDENSDDDLYYHKTTKHSAEVNKENRKAKRSKRVPREAEVKVLEVTPAAKTRQDANKKHGKPLQTLATPNTTNNLEDIERRRFEDFETTPYLVIDSPYMPSHVSLTSLEEKLTECKYADDGFGTADENNEVTWKFDATSQISNATHISSLRTPKTPRHLDVSESLSEEDDEQNIVETSTAVQITKQGKEGPHKRRKCCTPHITPTLSIRKPESEDADEDSQSIDQDSTSEMLTLSTSLQPRRLFEKTALYTVEREASEEEEEPLKQNRKEEEHELLEQNLEDDSSESNELDNENNSLQQNEQTAVGGLDDTLRLLQSFNADIEKNLLAKRKRLDALSKTTIQSTHRKLSSIWQQQNSSRHSVIENFQAKFFEELSSLEREVSKIKSTETEALHLFEKQYQVLQHCNASHRTRVQRMKKLNMSLVHGLQAVDNQPKSDKVSVKQTLKLEMQSLQKKVIQDSAQEELAHMRRNLQTLYY